MEIEREYQTGEREYPVTKKRMENDDDYSAYYDEL
jgi:hypothetical protein